MGILIPRQYASKIYLLGLALLVIGLPLSKFLMSVSQFILAGYWLLGEDSGTTPAASSGSRFKDSLSLLASNIRNRFRRFFRNPSAMVLGSVFVLHLIGLLWTSDFTYGLEDIRKKVPLLILPLIIATSDKLNRGQFDLIMGLFIAAVAAGTMVSMAVLTGIIERPLLDVRDISIFISHIRFSLLIVLAIFVLGFYIWHAKGYKRLGYLLLMAWLVVFLVILESITGLVILLFTATVLAIYHLVTRREWWRRIAYVYLAGLALLISGIYYYVNDVVKQYRAKAKNEHLAELPAATPRGNPYYHDTISPLVENGYRVWIYLCWNELQAEWNKRSDLDFEGSDRKGNELKVTLIRFITSKGDPKDADGVRNLTDREVRSIERGIANVDHQGMTSLKSRIQQIVWEIDLYMKGGNPSGHSVTQRMEFWKAAAGIISNNRWIGVGTGDPKKEFDRQYEETDSPLGKEYRLRSHNQFLAITVALGFFGLAWFVFSLLFPMLKERRINNYFYISFLLIAILSMFTEDTLETQAGVTFFAFFNSFFLFSRGKYEGDKIYGEELGIGS
jgi:hypothetical protein